MFFLSQFLSTLVLFPLVFWPPLWYSSGPHKKGIEGIKRRPRWRSRLSGLQSCLETRRLSLAGYSVEETEGGLSWLTQHKLAVDKGWPKDKRKGCPSTDQVPCRVAGELEEVYHKGCWKTIGVARGSEEVLRFLSIFLSVILTCFMSSCWLNGLWVKRGNPCFLTH